MAKPSVIPAFLSMILLALTLAFAGCSNINSAIPANPSQKPLDPQGNWLFTLTDTNNINLVFAGQVFELNPPVVTSNEMEILTPLVRGDCAGSLDVNGQASGTNAINLTLSSKLPFTGVPTPAYTLIGTIADDQQHMSGTFDGTVLANCTSAPTGTWTASLIPNVDGTWAGTVSSGTFSAALTEDVAQDINMGFLTGTVTVSGNSCLVSGTYNLVGSNTSQSNAGISVHSAETMLLAFVDSAGTIVNATLNVDPSTNNTAVGFINYNSPAAQASSRSIIVPCSTQQVTLTKQ